MPIYFLLNINILLKHSLLNKSIIKASSLFKSNQGFMYPDQVKYSVVERPSKKAFIRIYEEIKDETLDSNTNLSNEE